jgi:acetyl esterase/lipase
MRRPFDLDTHHVLCARLAKHAAAVVVAIDYRFGPEHKFPSAVDDCFAAYRRLRAHGRDLGEDSARVVYREYPGQIDAFVSLTKAIPQGLTCTLEIADYLRQGLR